jgi:pyridoxamine 5'-phosphate oxidase
MANQIAQRSKFGLRLCLPSPSQRPIHLIDKFVGADIVRVMLDTSLDPNAARYEHAAHGLRRRDLDSDPIKQFGNWFTAAIEAGIRDVNAMSLATAGRNAKPSVRVVLLKGFGHDGFVFFTNYESEKGRHLAENPYAALAFYWIELDRQVRINGAVEKTSRDESDHYFHSRSIGSQLGAWASRQSEVVDGRRVLDARMAEVTERYGDKPIPLPPLWGGYRLKPDTMEFWQGRPNRLHDRFRYVRRADGSWQIDRLAP